MGLLNSKVTVYSVDLACSLADFLEAFSGYKLHCDLPHSNKALTGAFLCGVCMFPMCL